MSFIQLTLYLYWRYTYNYMSTFSYIIYINIRTKIGTNTNLRFFNQGCTYKYMTGCTDISHLCYIQLYEYLYKGIATII